MIGASFSLDALCGKDAAFGDPAIFLKKLKDHGVESIEIRPVPIGCSADEAARVVNEIWNLGLKVTLHADVDSLESAVCDVFYPLEKIFSQNRQGRIVIIVHPIVGDNTAMLKLLSDYIYDNHLPAVIALENNRLMPDGSVGDCTEVVLDAVICANRDNVGICFDTGHYYNYVMRNRAETPEILPDKEFMRRVIHTHIHALMGYTPHFPVGKHSLPLERYMSALPQGYNGVYDLEIDHYRLVKDGLDPLAELIESVNYLKDIVQI